MIIMMKRFLMFIGVMLGVAIVVLAFLLIPAHIQVRSVTPDLPTQDDLLALRSNQAPVNVSYVLTSSQPLRLGQISHISVLVEWANGDLFMIDTGMSEEQASDFGSLLKKMDSSAGEVTIVGTISSLLGAKIKDVKGVGFTHLHIDHTQGLENFCQARGPGALVLQTPSQKTLHNFNTTEGAAIIEDSCLEDEALLSSTGGALLVSERFPGVAAFQLGGHTPGSTLWAVALGEKVLLFSGDITNDKSSIEHNKAKSLIYSYLFVPENTKRTTELRKWLKELDQSNEFSVIVSHDLNNTQTHLHKFNRNTISSYTNPH
jgi:glyoxylase-like metal-dependent hydrolase (beta-lactamase superfamily II)